MSEIEILRKKLEKLKSPSKGEVSQPKSLGLPDSSIPERPERVRAQQSQKAAQTRKRAEEAIVQHKQVETPQKLSDKVSAKAEPIPEVDRIRLLRYAKKLVSVGEFQTVYDAMKFFSRVTRKPISELYPKTEVEIDPALLKIAETLVFGKEAASIEEAIVMLTEPDKETSPGQSDSVIAKAARTEVHEVKGSSAERVVLLIAITVVASLVIWAFVHLGFLR